MNLAWEVTVDDVAIVLGRHAIQAGADWVFDDHFVGNTVNCVRVEHAALAATEFDLQCAAALEEIDLILTEVGIVPA